MSNYIGIDAQEFCDMLIKKPPLARSVMERLTLYFSAFSKNTDRPEDVPLTPDEGPVAAPAEKMTTKKIEINITKCMARIASGKQCTRKKKDGDYCGLHCKKTPKFGRIDGDFINPNLPTRKKRGRPKKNTSNNTTTDKSVTPVIVKEKIDLTTSRRKNSEADRAIDEALQAIQREQGFDHIHKATPVFHNKLNNELLDEHQDFEDVGDI